MALAVSPRALTRASARHPWRVVAAWVVLFLASGALISRLLTGALTTQANFTNDPESVRGLHLVEDQLTGPVRTQEYVIVRADKVTVDDPSFRSYVSGLVANIRGLIPKVVLGETDPIATNGQGLISADRRTALIPVTMAGSQADATDNIEFVHDVTIHTTPPAGFHLLQFGDATVGADFKTLSEKDLKKGEGFGIPIALIVLVLVFGALIAALVPVFLAIIAIVVALGFVSLIGTAWHFSFFVVNMITMMGLAVGIDYSLFIVSRYREERQRGVEKLDAIVAAGSTASRAVWFSGITVVVALLGMLLVPTTIFRSLGAGAIFVVLAAIAASMTLLPATLALLGDRIDKLHIPALKRASQATAGGMWDRITRTVMRRPIVSVVLAAGLLLAAAVPVLNLHTGFSGISTIGEKVQSKQAFNVLARDFSGGLAQPARIVIDGSMDDAVVRAGLARLAIAVGNDPAFGPPQPVQVNEARTLALLEVPIKGDPVKDEATNAIRRLRNDLIPRSFNGVPARVLVTGYTAFNADFFSVTRKFTPIVFGFVLGLSFLVLMLVFRSIVVPAKAIVMNLLSVGAAYGLVVLVNQEGRGAGILGFQRVEVIEAWLPLFLFSVLFGLSMDYHVFLLSRIREHYGETKDNTESVAFGVRTTGRLITGAALIMVAVFAGFATGDLVMLQQMGFGLAVAVLIDATIVRSVLVPASMRLLGTRNWYLPRWLEWLPQIHIESIRAPEVIDLTEKPAIVDITDDGKVPTRRRGRSGAR